ncbi:MAG: glucose-6-phosphate isomerase, partial [Roseomonas sp.]|nr:glucose-6-phosphate isomerase [Roseomonas sp.]
MAAQGEARRTAWNAVRSLAAAPGARAIRARLDAEPERFARFARRGAGLLLDLSRTALDDTALAALLNYARAANVTGFRDAMARGEAVNATERRAALHLALRAPPGSFRTGAEDASAEVHATLAAMERFTRAVHDGTLRGATGEQFRDVVNIGIGGSDLGPAMATRALWHQGSPM